MLKPLEVGEDEGATCTCTETRQNSRISAGIHKTVGKKQSNLAYGRKMHSTADTYRKREELEDDVRMTKPLEDSEDGSAACTCAETDNVAAFQQEFMK